MDAIYVHVRYETPDEKGETRRERNIAYEIEESTPDFEIPEHGVHLWEMFWSVSDALIRIRDGVCSPIPPSEFFAWCQLSGTIISPVEYAILRAMDDKFCSETNAELVAYRARQEAQQRQEQEANKPKRRR